MRVAIVAPPWFTVPPAAYGGIESVVALLADGLAEAGHDATLIATGPSHTRANLLVTADEPQHARLFHAVPDLAHSLRALEMADRFDLVNDHSGLVGAALTGLWPVPACHTVHGRIDGEEGTIYRRLARSGAPLHLISVSRSQRSPLPDLPWIANCPNAIDLDAHPLSAAQRDGLVFLGRLSPDKGAARAIDVAEQMGLPLRIAGKCTEPIEQAYFEREIQPRLSGRIEWLGEVPQADKVRLLAEARCTLFPISWPEPFGLVMAESMACGTPVVATRFGAVPEVIGGHGRGGVIVDRTEDLAAGVEAAFAIDPASCRAYAERMFSARRMVADYVEAYEELLDRAAVPAATAA